MEAAVRRADSAWRASTLHSASFTINDRDERLHAVTAKRATSHTRLLSCMQAANSTLSKLRPATKMSSRRHGSFEGPPSEQQR